MDLSNYAVGYVFVPEPVYNKTGIIVSADKMLNTINYILNEYRDRIDNKTISHQTIQILIYSSVLKHRVKELPVNIWEQSPKPKPLMAKY